MAITLTLLDTRDGNLTSATLTPSSNSLLIVATTVRRSNPFDVTGATTTLSNVGTWTEVEGPAHDYGAQSTQCSILYARVTGSPGSGTITVTASQTPTASITYFLEATGFNTNSPIYLSSSGANTTANPLSLGGTTRTGDVALAILSTLVADTIAPANSDWTEIQETLTSTYIRAQIQKSTVASVTQSSWTTTGTVLGISSAALVINGDTATVKQTNAASAAYSGSTTTATKGTLAKTTIAASAAYSGSVTKSARKQTTNVASAAYSGAVTTVTKGKLTKVTAVASAAFSGSVTTKFGNLVKQTNAATSTYSGAVTTSSRKYTTAVASAAFSGSVTTKYVPGTQSITTNVASAAFSAGVTQIQSSALTLTLLDTTTAGTGTNRTSGTITPSSGCLLVIAITGERSASWNYTGVTTTLSNVGAWTEIQSANHDSGVDATQCSIFYAQVTGNPGSGTVTVTANLSQASSVMFVLEVTGHDTTTPVELSPVGSDTTANPLSLGGTVGTDGDLALAIFSAIDATSIAPANGDWTEINEDANLQTRAQIQKSTNAVTQSQWSTTGTVTAVASAGIVFNAAGAYVTWDSLSSWDVANRDWDGGRVLVSGNQTNAASAAFSASTTTVTRGVLAKSTTAASAAFTGSTTAKAGTLVKTTNAASVAFSGSVTTVTRGVLTKSTTGASATFSGAITTKAGGAVVWDSASYIYSATTLTYNGSQTAAGTVRQTNAASSSFSGSVTTVTKGKLTKATAVASAAFSGAVTVKFGTLVKTTTAASASFTGAVTTKTMGAGGPQSKTTNAASAIFSAAITRQPTSYPPGRLVWGESGKKRFETGLDRGVLYIDGTGVPWSGLVSVDIESENSSVEIYFNGEKTFDLISLGDFTGRLKAVTYPEEFLEFEGSKEHATGLVVHDQPIAKTFGLSYRTKIGNDVDNTEHGYKIHVLYNLTAVPSTNSFLSIGDVASPNVFEWSITGVPEYVEYYRPTAYLVFDSTILSASSMQRVEDILYGTVSTSPTLPDIITLMDAGGSIIIEDNGDGTWTATCDEEFITMLNATTFQISSERVEYLDQNTYTITSS